MLAALLALLPGFSPVRAIFRAPSAQSETTLSLSRGVKTHGLGPITTYQDVEDTTLDSAEPDSAHGGDYTLSGGPGKTILIRFGDLRRAVGPGQKIVEATLVLAPSGDGPIQLHAASRLLKRWGEGPAATFTGIAKVADPNAKVATPYGAATWKAAVADAFGGGWHAPGALSEADATPIPAAIGKLSGSNFEISGLAGIVEAMLEDPTRNDGFALTFDTPCEFVSSEAGQGKPILRLRLTPEATAAKEGPDLAIVSMTSTPTGIRATLKNVGTTVAHGFRTTWSEDQLEGIAIEQTTAVEPGATVTLAAPNVPKQSDKDHRVGPVSLRITPVGPEAGGDVGLADKQLTVYPSGIPISVHVPAALAAELVNLGSPRGPGFENWLQAQIQEVNDVYLARSRFSFAPDGCLERIRVQQVRYGDEPAESTLPTVEVEGADLSPVSDGRRFVAAVIRAIGAPDYSGLEFQLGDTKVKAAGWDVGGLTAFPDVLHSGDTRFEGGLPNRVPLQPTAAFDPILDVVVAEPTTLLAGHVVGILNGAVGTEGANRKKVISALELNLPTTNFFVAADSQGRPLKNAELLFFQARAGAIDDAAAFTVLTSENGTVLLPSRPVNDGGTVKTNVFGSADLTNEGAFLVRASFNGERAWGWLKVWQLQEAYLRGSTGLATTNLQFSLPSDPVDRSANLALGRLVTDSAGDFPAKLSALTDGAGTTSVTLPAKAGDWVEVDLNKDRSVAEIQLLTSTPEFWQRFDIVVYQTGQKVEQATPWSHETFWSWTFANRGIKSGSSQAVAYHGPTLQVRYVRIVAKVDGPASLAQIKAFGIK